MLLHPSPSLALALACACLVPASRAAAQSPSRPEPATAIRATADASEPEGDKEEGEEEEAIFEGEFIASTLFQSATAAFRLRAPLVLESHYFGVEENDFGMVGLGWTFSHKEFRVVPGVGWSFSREGRPAPVVTVRWSYESPRWLTQGLWVQSLRAYVPDTHHEDHEEESTEEMVRHASILDGIHASAVLGRAEVGPLVEHIRYREENEWKGGVRVAWRLGHGLKLVSQIVGPGAEIRGGLTWEP